jgi:hypothetical protein
MSSSESSETRDSVRFAERVDPDDSISLSYEVVEDATIEEMRVRIYPGPEHDLRIFPYVDRGKGERSRREELVEFRGKEYIDGNGDHFKFPISVDVEEEQTIGVDVENLEVEYAYDFVVDFDLDHAGGTSRFIPGFLRRLI